MSGAAITGAFMLASAGALFLLLDGTASSRRSACGSASSAALIFCALQIFPTGDQQAQQRLDPPAVRIRGDGGAVPHQQGSAAGDHRQPRHAEGRARLDHRDAALPLVPHLAPLELDGHRPRRHPDEATGPTRSRSSTTRTTSWSGWARILLLIAAVAVLPALAQEALLVEGGAVGADARVPVHDASPTSPAGQPPRPAASHGPCSGCCTRRTRRPPATPSPPAPGIFTLLGFAGLYLFLGILYLVMVLRIINQGPEDPSDDGPAGDPAVAGAAS